MKKMKYLVSVLLVLVMVLSLCACGGSKSKQEEPAEDNEFLLGSWFARTASQNGQTADAEKVFGGTFMLYFSGDGVCTMSIDQQRALLDWELTDNGVILKGDGTYEGTFQDEAKTTMVIVINGIDVLMEKYED